MTLPWTFTAVFLCVEIFVVCLLLVPLISPSRWRQVFRLRLVTKFANDSHIYFNVFIAILLLLFLEACREVHKYSGSTSKVDLKHNADQQNLALMKLFRAQRNLYIAGFTLFLWFIIRRLVTLISHQAQLYAEGEASKKQAQDATDAAKKLMARLEDTELDAAKREQDMASKLKELRAELEETNEDLKKKSANFTALKSQTEGTNKEYDRLLKEYELLQKKLESSGDGDSKKSK